MTVKFTTIPTKTLASSITSSATSFQLNSITGWDGANLASGDFGTQGYGVFRDASRTILELFEFDPTTIADNSITIVRRGLQFDGDLTTEVAGNKRSWTQGDTFVDLGTDTPQFFQYLKEYADSVAAASASDADNTTKGVTRLTEDLGDRTRAMAALVHEQGTPNMTLTIEPFSITIRDKHIVYTGGNTATMTAPSANPRIDLIVYDTVDSAIDIRTGTEGASPSEPTPKKGDIVLASVYHETTETSLKDETDGTNGYIKSWYQPDIYGKEGVANIDQEQTTQDSSEEVGEADSTTNQHDLAQSFKTDYASIRGVELYKSADTGSFTGTVTVSIQADSSGAPSGSDLASTTISNARWVDIPTGAFQVGFTSELTVVQDATYWIVITPSTGDNANHPNIGANSAGGYSEGGAFYSNVTDGWTAITGVDLYFKVLAGVNSKIITTESDGLLNQAVVPHYVIDLENTNAAFGGDTTENTEYNKVLPADVFSNANGGIKLNMIFNFTAVSSNDDLRVQIKINGTKLLDVGSGEITTAGSGKPDLTNAHLSLEFISINNGATNSQKSRLVVRGHNTESSATGVEAYFKTFEATSAIDTATGINIIEVTTQANDAGITGNIRSFLLEKITKF